MMSFSKKLEEDIQKLDKKVTNLVRCIYNKKDINPNIQFARDKWRIWKIQSDSNAVIWQNKWYKREIREIRRAGNKIMWVK